MSDRMGIAVIVIACLVIAGSIAKLSHDYRAAERRADTWKRIAIEREFVR